ncbi:unnamed protein product [Paramecium sonneborni]|uniref:Uncharacterized protein n=1 Tax=Paramecium sonneborni TaxID=65129 RepID=A0A8S1PN57_9CILI|nr:unnamed protein product [Paramecium sonneborni]
MPLFIDYLVDIGVIVNKYSIQTNNILFSLSDYLKNLSASDSFDMALRLYDGWKLEQTKKKNPGNLLEIINKIALRQPFKLLQQSQKRNKIQFSPNKIENSQKSPCNKQQSYQSPINKKSFNYMGLNDTCERLYMEGIVQKVKKEQYEQEKQQLELKDCTFKPQVNVENIRNKEIEVFDRLYRTQLVSKNDFSEIKQKQEISQCTFTPSINKQEQISNFLPLDNKQTAQTQIFDRLFQESIQRSNLKSSYAPYREQKQLQECTFKPQISNRQLNRSGDDIFKRLHNESVEKQQIQAFQKLDKESKELEQCTFKPKINTNCNFSPNVQPAFDRLYMLSTKSKKTLFDDSQQKPTINKTKDQSSIQNNESLFERMKSHVDKKKRNIYQIKQEVDKELTFKPNINVRSQNNIQSKQSYKHQSIFSVKSEPKLKPTANTLSTYVYNTRKSQQDKENSNLSMYCETAYFQEDQKLKPNILDFKQ